MDTFNKFVPLNLVAPDACASRSMRVKKH